MKTGTPPSAAGVAPSHGAASIAHDLDRQRRSGGLQHIAVPPCPQLLVRLQTAMSAAEPDLGEVARIASSDVAMSATLVRAAGGARFAAFGPARTVGQAMNRLGLSETAALMTGFLTRHAIPVNNRHLERFWERSTRRAVAMAFMAGELPGLSPDLAYTFGLFSHVGLPVLLHSVKGYGATLVEAHARRDRSFVATENANHRTDHAVVGALVARTWRLAPAVMAAIRLHHDLFALGARDAEPEVHTLVAAGLVAEHLMRRYEGLDAERDWLDHGEAALAWLQVGPEDLQDWDSGLSVRLDDAV